MTGWTSAGIFAMIMSATAGAARGRVRSAARILRSNDRTVASVAAEFGYTSESSFSNTFKRVTGHAPARHRHLTPGTGVRPEAGEPAGVR